MKQKEEEYKFQAAIMGVDLESNKEVPKTQTVDGKGTCFKSPEDYAAMSDTEREEETQRMMAVFGPWSRTVLNKGK